MELAGEKLDLVAYQFLERLSEVEVEVAGVVAFDLTSRCGARVSEGLRGGVTLSVLLTQNRIGKSIFFAARPGR